jgi:hypothetical protein
MSKHFVLFIYGILKNVLMFVRHVSQVLLGKGFYALRLASRRDFTHRTFFTMSRGQRAERLFVVFGYYPSSEKNGILQGWLTDWLRSGRTSSRMYDPLPASFWLPKGEFSLHAIAILYDADGNGTIDDPGHRVYHPVTPSSFFRSCACICSVYELSIVLKGK